MWARRAASVLAVVATLAGCGGSGIPTPAPASVTPARGFAASATPVVISGSGFSVLTVQSSTGGAPTVDETFQAWLGDQALLDVRRVDESTLSATVPAGLAPGPHSLRVQGPFGTSGELAAAFTVEGTAQASLTAAIAAAPATVSVGQSITVTLTVTNSTTTAATGVAPSVPVVTGSATVAASTGPLPASIATLAPGASGTFTWTYRATGAGSLAFAGGASATDSFSGLTVTCATDPARPAAVTVQSAAALTASLPAAGAAALGQEFTVAMTVSNTGGAAATSVVPGVPVLVPAGMAALKTGTGPVPASVASLAGGASASFTWTFVAGTTSGSLRISAGASGTDANSGASVASATATSGPLTIGAAGLLATLAASPAVASAGQAVSVRLTLRNPGLADVLGLVVGTPVASSTDGASAARTSGPSPAPPTVLAAGQTAVVDWSFLPTLTAGASTGNLSFLVTASGTDAFSRAPVTAQSSAPITVQTPAVVTATSLVPSTSTVNVGQGFSVTLNLAKTGAAPANVTGATLTGAGVVCTGEPAPVSGIGATLGLTWTGCTATVTGLLSASATWVDANVGGTPVSTSAVTAPLTVQAAAGVTASSLVPSASIVNVGQAFSVTLNLAKSGDAPANVTGATLTGAGVVCTGEPAPVNGIPATLGLTWTGCTATVTGLLSASATWVDANVGGTPVPTNTATAPLTVQAPAVVTAVSLVPSASTVNVGQAFSVTLNLTKSGDALANVTGATLTGAGVVCAGVPPPVNGIPASLALTWTGCTATASGLLSASATWLDANVGGAPVPTSTVTAPLTVQTPAAVTAVSLVPSASTVNLGQAFSVTLTLTKSGEAPANVTGATLTGAGVVCTGVPPPVNGIPATLVLTWTGCTATASGLLSATATWLDANVGGTPVPTSTATAPLTVQVPAAVTATSLATDPAIVPVDIGFSVTLLLSKTGEAPANVVEVSLTGAACIPPAVPIVGILPVQAITWTCNPIALPGSGAMQATVRWLDGNDPTVVQAPVSLSGTIVAQ